MEILRPKTRRRLTAKMILCGYRSKAEFGRFLQVSYPTISSILLGWKFPSPGMQQKLCAGLGVSIKELERLL